MTTNAIVVHHPADTSLSISTDQSTFTDSQVAALRHMGVDGAGPGDLEVFFHVVKRTGLDPFARQIYMISRWSKDGPKQTIQTGIDGFRLIGRRAADRAKVDISLSAPEWAHEDGSWRPVWSTAWGMPVAARVTITRGDSPFTAVAIFDEYKQTKRDGGLTQMWAQRPAGQIAKCAEALAWRMAFPQDLAGVYADDEMAHADSAPKSPPPVQTFTATPVAEPMTDKTRRHMFALFGQKGITEDKQLAGINYYTGQDYTSRGDLTEQDARTVISRLEELDDAEADEVTGEVVEADPFEGVEA